MDFQRFFIDFRRFRGQKVWQPVAACGNLWRRIGSPLRNFAARQAGRTGRAGRQDRQGRQAGQAGRAGSAGRQAGQAGRKASRQAP